MSVQTTTHQCVRQEAGGGIEEVDAASFEPPFLGWHKVGYRYFVPFGNEGSESFVQYKLH